MEGAAGAAPRRRVGARPLADELLATSLQLVQVRDHHEQPLCTEGRVVAVCTELSDELGLASDPRLAVCNAALRPRQLREQL
jgi:hypothetical protein